MGGSDETYVPGFDVGLGHGSPVQTLALPERYRDLGVIARGGMAEVRRVYDRTLRRDVVMKVIHASLADASLRARFVDEAQATAQLQHPGIVPVHDLGELPDGRPFFTMKEVVGETLARVVQARREGDSAWSLRAVIGVFHRVCEAVAYAHDRGVIHRDLKPDNLMVGAFGEVHVMDWGLAKVVGAREALAPSVTRGYATRVGSVSGTPAYMPPEQARGEIASLDPRADVYALGAVLYTILVGESPYAQIDGDVVSAVLSGPPAPVEDRVRAPMELRRLCAHAMAREVELRPPTAADLAERVRGWLDGEDRRDEAHSAVAEARRRPTEVAALLDRAQALELEAERALDGLGPADSEEAKAPAWALEDEAAALRERAWQGRVEQEGLLHAALHKAGVTEAHAELAALYLVDHRAAESRRDKQAAVQAEVKLQRQLDALPAAHPVAVEGHAYLEGGGELDVRTEVEVEAEICRFSTVRRRLVAEPLEVRRGLKRVRLPMGSYLIRLRGPGRHVVDYPVMLGRQGRWTLVRPGSDAPWVVRLPPPLPAGQCFVPAGPFLAGDGRGLASSSLAPEEIWVDDLVFAQHPVSNAAFIEFLDDLVACGREEEALAAAPRERSAKGDSLGELVYGRDAYGRFILRPDADGDQWLPDWPVLMVDWFGARAYAAWLAERTGVPWRLPTELEWEKAARGVDGRLYPWGDFADPSWACLRDSRHGPPSPALPHEFSVDTSPYGLRHIAGNVREWTLSGPEPDVRGGVACVPTWDSVPERVVDRGGTWAGDLGWGRTIRRGLMPPSGRDASVGFRLCYSWAPQ